MTRCLIPLLVLAMFTGCATGPRAPTLERGGPPVIDRSQPPPAAVPRVDGRTPPPTAPESSPGAKRRLPAGVESPPPPVSVLAKPAVINLARAADQASAEGRYATAASSLERALRIEPHNASLWHKLARVRYQQAQYDQAVQLASKANTLTRQSLLRTANWQLIADAYDRLGDEGKARAARAQALDR